MFIAPTDLSLKDKIIYMKIGFPELAPRILELKAVVLDAKPCFNARNSEIRAKFIDLSEENKAGLAVIDKIIQKREGRSLN